MHRQSYPFNYLTRHPDRDALGLIPNFLSLDDPGTVAEQLNRNYAHGGGWSPFGKSQWQMDPNTFTLKYPGDPAMLPIASTTLRDERVFVYPHAFVAIVQKDGTFEVSRLD